MLPDLSVVWVIFFVLLLTVVLDRLLFKPLLRVMEERQRAITSARELAERSANEARLAAAEFDRKTGEARAELYRQMDEMRRTAMGERVPAAGRLAIMMRTVWFLRAGTSLPRATMRSLPSSSPSTPKGGDDQPISTWPDMVCV